MLKLKTMKMNIYIRLLTILLALISGAKVYAQQDLMVSQQIFSRMNINPAGTGNIPPVQAGA